VVWFYLGCAILNIIGFLLMVRQEDKQRKNFEDSKAKWSAMLAGANLMGMVLSVMFLLMELFKAQAPSG
jgi:hypothetical protein